MSNTTTDVNRAERMVPASAGEGTNFTQAFVTTAATVGVIAAGAALLEIALIPGIVIGGAAVLAPNLLPEYKLLPNLRRRLKPLLDFSPPIASKPSVPGLPVVKPPIPVQFTIQQAIAKTITYRIIVTTLDFTVNYVVIGEVATAGTAASFPIRRYSIS